MSLRAMLWAVYDAPVDHLPMLAYRVLLRLADRADEHGCGAFPGAGKMAEELGATRRTIERHLATLLEEGLTRHGDQRLVAHLRPHERPRVWDVCLDRLRPPPGAGPDDPEPVPAEDLEGSDTDPGAPSQEPLLAPPDRTVGTDRKRRYPPTGNAVTPRQLLSPQPSFNRPKPRARTSAAPPAPVYVAPPCPIHPQHSSVACPACAAGSRTAAADLAAAQVRDLARQAGRRARESTGVAR